MFKFLHWSDPHGKGNLTYQTAQLADMLQVDESICSGDLVPDYFEQDISNLALDGVLLVTGNHDVILEAGTDPSGYQWDKQPAVQQTYDKYYKPYAAGSGITIEENTTYWYKDVSYGGKTPLRILGIDSQARGDLLTSQSAWLHNMISYCIANKVPVLINSHYPNSKLVCLKNSWLDRPYYPSLVPDTASSETNWYPAILQTYSMVCNALASGLEVAAWVCGHEHADCLFEGGTEKYKFPFITIAATIPDHYSDLIRSDYGTVDAICTNYCEYVPEEKVLRLYRLGAGASKGGSVRRCAIWDYNKSKWVVVLDRAEGW